MVGPAWLLPHLARVAEERSQEYVWLPTTDIRTADACIVVHGATERAVPIVHPAVLWSLDGQASAQDVDMAFARGFDAVVEGDDALVVIAQLDALVRRPPPESSPAVRRMSTVVAAIQALRAADPIKNDATDTPS